MRKRGRLPGISIHADAFDLSFNLPDLLPSCPHPSPQPQLQHHHPFTPCSIRPSPRSSTRPFRQTHRQPHLSLSSRSTRNSPSSLDPSLFLRSHSHRSSLRLHPTYSTRLSCSSQEGRARSKSCCEGRSLDWADWRMSGSGRMGRPWRVRLGSRCTRKSERGSAVSAPFPCISQDDRAS